MRISMYIHVYPPPGLVVDRVDIEHLDVDSEWPGGKGFPHFTQYISRRFPVYTLRLPFTFCTLRALHSTQHPPQHILHSAPHALFKRRSAALHWQPYTLQTLHPTPQNLYTSYTLLNARHNPEAALQTPHFALQTLDPTTLRAPHCRLCPARYIHSPLHAQGSKLHTSHATRQNCSFLKQALLQTPHSPLDALHPIFTRTFHTPPSDPTLHTASHSTRALRPPHPPSTLHNLHSTL